jgi:Transposase
VSGTLGMTHNGSVAPLGCLGYELSAGVVTRHRCAARCLQADTTRRRTQGRTIATTRLANTVDGVIGVDTHRDTLAAAATDQVGGTLAQATAAADLAGYQQLLEFGRARVSGRRCWAVEGAGSYGAGLAAFLHAQGERVWRSGGPSGRRGRSGAKSDALDAVRAARETLALDHPWPRVAEATEKRCGCCWRPAIARAWQSQRHQ